MIAKPKAAERTKVERPPRWLAARDRLIGIAITDALAACSDEDEVTTETLVRELDRWPVCARATVNSLLDVELYDAIGLIAVGRHPWAYIEMNAALRRIAVGFYVAGLEQANEKVIRAAPMETLSYLFKRAEWWTASDRQFALKLEAISSAIANHDFDALQKHVRRRDTPPGPRDVYVNFDFNMEGAAADLARTLSLCMKIMHPLNKRAPPSSRPLLHQPKKQ